MIFFFFFSSCPFSLWYCIKSTQVPGETSLLRISSDRPLFLPADLGVPVDCYEPQREPAFHHGHHTPDHPLLQRDSPSQFRALSGVYIEIRTRHSSFPSRACSWRHWGFLPVASRCDFLGDAVLCFADHFPDHTVLSVKFQWWVLQAREVGDKPDATVSARPFF